MIDFLMDTSVSEDVLSHPLLSPCGHLPAADTSGMHTTVPPLNATKWLVNVGSDLIELPTVRNCLIFLHVLGIILGAIGNGLLIYSMLRHRKRMRSNVTAYLVLNLVVCQMVCITVYQPMRLADILLPSTSVSESGQNLYCQISGFFATFFGCVAFHTIVAISQERLVLICWPLWAKRVLTVRNTRLLLASIWLVALAATFPLPFFFTFQMNLGLQHTDVTFCIVDVFTRKNGGRAYFSSLFCLYYAMPVLILTVTYCKIFTTLYSAPRTAAEEGTTRVLRSRRSLAKRMLLIAVIFTLCQGPYYVTFLLICTGIHVRSNPVFVLVIVEFLPVVGYVLNPLVYYSPSQGFHRIAIRSIISHEGDTQRENSTILAYQTTRNSRLNHARLQCISSQNINLMDSRL